MAVPAIPDPNQSLDESMPPELARMDPEVRECCLHVAELFGLGHSKRDIVRVVAAKLYKDAELGPDAKMSNARQRVRKWEKKQWFRDLVWDRAVVELDMSTPQILRGVARKARRGRVDAAKLALSITGRHTEKSETTPAAVTINLNAIPRPNRQAVTAPDEIVIEADED